MGCRCKGGGGEYDKEALNMTMCRSYDEAIERD